MCFVNSIESNIQTVTMGVPQGSVLGPLLFLIYINDLQNCMESVPRLFADDTVILDIVNSIQELEHKLNQQSNMFQTG